MASSSSSSTSSEEKAVVASSQTASTATWTRYLPETFGIRNAVNKSPYRWCTRESVLWGIATGTAMGLHRLRMGSTPKVAGNFAFGTVLLVCGPSYYFCVKKRDYQEQWIEQMMRANDIATASEMPPQPKENPFLAEEEGEGTLFDKELYGRLPERKEFQPQVPTQNVKDVFTEKEDK